MIEKARAGVIGKALLDTNDLQRLREGTHEHLHDSLGCQLDAMGARFTLWAPNARAVAVIGDFNGWSDEATSMRRCGNSGLWEARVDGVANGDLYKYRVGGGDGSIADKADPIAFACESPPGTASRAWQSRYVWNDAEWMLRRARVRASDAGDVPVSIYEVHFGSWRGARDGGLPNYRDMALELARYVSESAFTHVEFLPLAEHPAYGSLGYRSTGYFAPTARYGTPDDFMFLIDTLHQAGIGVILDWVPSHFSDYAHGLGRFDGGALYERADPHRGAGHSQHPMQFDYARPEVRAFLLSSALFWLERYHIDGLRVDAVASMLYLDYGRRADEWEPNRSGGKENLEAIDFLRRFNETVGSEHPDVCTIAEESSAWPMISRPVHLGGLGFSMAWNTEWTRHALDYIRRDPLFRSFHHEQLTVPLLHAFQENFILPLGHDEVTAGRGSLFGKMPGDDWQRFAGLRALYGYMWAYPGKKLLFMGGEFAQRGEWALDDEEPGGLDWAALDDPRHGGMRRWIGDLNRFYRAHRALHELDFEADGFRWIDANDRENSVLSFLRCARDGAAVLAVCNFTPVLRTNYVVGVPREGCWREALNSDAPIYGGSGTGNFGRVDAMPVPAHGEVQSLNLTLPPHGFLFFVPEDGHADVGS